MLWQLDGDSADVGHDRRPGVVVAGPGSILTIPGIIVSEIARALAATKKVTRVEVDAVEGFAASLDRAPSLAAAHGANETVNFKSHHAPNDARLRLQAFRDWITPEIGIAIAYAWPGLDNSWIKQFLQVAKAAGAKSVVLCESLPGANGNSAASLTEVMSGADRIFVGEVADASILGEQYGARGPIVDIDPALSLGGRRDRSDARKFTAFLPRDNRESLATVLAAFDAIPEAWVDDFELQLVMRYAGEQIPDMVAGSFHAERVRLIGDDISAGDLEELCDLSSALGVANPASDSRAFSTAMDKGVATVVLASSPLLSVGTGYVGGLFADLGRPASIYVALNHALRLEALRFPGPDVWDELAHRLVRLPAEDRLSEDFQLSSSRR